MFRNEFSGGTLRGDRNGEVFFPSVEGSPMDFTVGSIKIGRGRDPPLGFFSIASEGSVALDNLVQEKLGHPVF